MSENENFLKSRSIAELAISDVKLSQLAREIDPTIATENILDRIRPNGEIIVQSKNTRAPHESESDNALSFLRAPQYYLKQTPESKRSEIFQDLDLECVFSTAFARKQTPIEIIFDKIPYTDQFKRDFVKQWLLTHALAIGDMYRGNNMLALDGNNQTRLSPFFDFEFGAHILNRDIVNNKNHKRFSPHPIIARDIYPFLELGIHESNIKFLHENMRETASEFFEKLRTFDKSKLAGILDTTQMKPFFAEYDQPLDLDEIATRAVDGYADRFKMLADQWQGNV